MTEEVIQQIFIPQVRKICKNERKSKKECEEICSCYSKLMERDGIRVILNDANNEEMMELKSEIEKMNPSKYPRHWK